jgi:hypothetical protein
MADFNDEQIKEFLAQRGYTVNPEGIVQPFAHDFEHISDTVCYLDVNSEAVRRGDEIPDRPIRLTFEKSLVARWELKAVGELSEGVASKALDRGRSVPKTSPWPEKKP